MFKTRIKISKKTGAVEILDTVGAGTSCLEATAAFEKDLGVAGNRTLTESYYAAANEEEQTINAET